MSHFRDFRTLRIMGKCTSRYPFGTGGLFWWDTLWSQFIHIDGENCNVELSFSWSEPSLRLISSNFLRLKAVLTTLLNYISMWEFLSTRVGLIQTSQVYLHKSEMHQEQVFLFHLKVSRFLRTGKPVDFMNLMKLRGNSTPKFPFC